MITKRGKQVALVTPIHARTLDLLGILKGKLQVHGDIVDTSDLAAGDAWSADEENLRPPVPRRKGRRTGSTSTRASLVGVLLGELTARERRRLEGDPAWGISLTVLWELAMLEKKGRISLDLQAYETRNALAAISVLPLSLDVARVACNLDFNADPADHLIAATSIVHKVPLLTRDKKIRSSKRVPLA